MSISQAILPEFDHEMESTRKALERVPEDRFGWKPHVKSMTLGRLAQHLTEIPGWASFALKQDSLDVAPPGAPPYQPPAVTSRGDMLKAFDRNVAAARAAIAETSDELFQKPWSLLSGGKTVMTMPRAAVLRSFVMSHGIHHRAQLGVYLRLNDIPVPAIYGQSADEGKM